jgi:hypothetical protein
MSVKISGQTMQLNVSGLGKGMYYIKIRGSKNRSAAKLIKL